VPELLLSPVRHLIVLTLGDLLVHSLDVQIMLQLITLELKSLTDQTVGAGLTVGFVDAVIPGFCITQVGTNLEVNLKRYGERHVVATLHFFRYASGQSVLDDTYGVPEVLISYGELQAVMH